MLRVAFHCDFQLMPHIMIVLVRNAYRESRLQLEDVYFYPFQELEIQKSAFLNSLLGTCENQYEERKSSSKKVGRSVTVLPRQGGTEVKTEVLSLYLQLD